MTADRRRRPLRHGTNAGYQRGCKCAGCRAANAARQRELCARRAAAGVPVPHGRTGYVNYECRCDACADAQREYMREYRARRRESA